jgi:hypothetical protein
MIIAGFFGEDTAPAAAVAAMAPTPTSAPAITPPVVPSAATRTPFTRPAQANPNFVPRSLDTGFIPEFETFPMVMLPQMPRVPQGIRDLHAGQAQAGGVPTAGALPADPSGQSSVPAGTPSPVKMRSGRMMPPGLVMALGIMPSIRGVRSGRVNPSAMVATGRKLGAL